MTLITNQLTQQNNIQHNEFNVVPITIALLIGGFFTMLNETL